MSVTTGWSARQAKAERLLDAAYAARSRRLEMFSIGVALTYALLDVADAIREVGADIEEAIAP